MKKEFAAKARALLAVTALILLMPFWQGKGSVQASAAGSLTKKILLDSENITRIPKYIREGGITYVLDESCIAVEEVGRSASEGADVVTRTWKAENLPDNDLERIEKTKVQDGISWELLCVVYEVTKEDEDGVPMEYSALCEYGGLEKYSRSYPSKWQAVCRYDVYSLMEIPEAVTEREEFVFADIRGEENGAENRYDRKQEAEKTEEEEEPLPEVKKYALKRISPGAKEKEKMLPDFPAALAAVIAGILLGLPFVIWIALLTAPLFAEKENQKYRYIGRIRLKKEEEDLTAYLTERLSARADLPVFKIKLRKGIREKIKGRVLQIRCPDGKRITSIAGREVRFTLERE